MSGTDSRAPLARREPPLPAALPEGDSAGAGSAGSAISTARWRWRTASCPFASRRSHADGCRLPCRAGAPRHVGGRNLGLLADLAARARRRALRRPLRRSGEAGALMKPELIWEIEGGLRLSAVDLYVASAARTRLYQALRGGCSRATTRSPCRARSAFPFPRDVAWPTAIAGHPMNSYHRWMEVVVPGHPVGRSRRLPAGRPRRPERPALRAAADRAAWRRSRPPACFARDVRGTEPNPSGDLPPL